MPEYIIGIMSGSSLDGLDMALCQFDESEGFLKWEILESQTVSFPSSIHHALTSAPTLSGFELMKLDADFGKFIGTQIKTWSEVLSVKADLIASHGHTVFHEPTHGFTTQIGSGAHIAFETGLDTITSFRDADIAAGGQGAPFAPVADKALFTDYDICLNLGGIANISMNTRGGQWIAWDIGPCNQALNHLALKLGQPYDKDGQMAGLGNELDEVIETLLAMFPYNEGKPKGLSNDEIQKSWIQYLDTSTENVNDLLASVTEAIARMVMNHISPAIDRPSKLLVTGGGAHNTELIRRIDGKAQDCEISLHLPSSLIIDFKECLLMAYLGYLTNHGKAYGIHKMTGARADSIGGAIHKAYP